MKGLILSLLLLLLLLAGCQSKRHEVSSQAQAGKVPLFEANDSDGKRITSSQFTNHILIVADSVAIS